LGYTVVRTEVSADLNYHLSNTNNNNNTRNSKGISNTRITKSSQAKFTSNGNSLTVRHREYINPVDLNNALLERTTAIGNTYAKREPFRYNINPADGATFPWLSNVAARFEKYKFKSLTFSYQPTCPTTTAGGIGLAIIYDAADDIPNNRTELFNAESCVRAAVYDSLTLPCKKIHLNKLLHTRDLHHGLVDANELRTSDVGYMIAAVYNISSDIQFGDLYVSYEVEFSGPKTSKTAAKSAWLQFDSGPNHSGVVGKAGDPYALTPYNGATNTVLDLPISDYAHKSNTLMLDVQHDGRSGHQAPDYAGAFNVNTDVTRIVFREPFTGFVKVLANDNGDATAGPTDVSFNHSIVPAGDTATRCIVEPVGATKHGGLGATFEKTIAIAANAGEVLDVVGKAALSTFSWVGKVAMVFTEAAPALIEAAEIIGPFLA